jgi:hypothetical protein
MKCYEFEYFTSHETSSLMHTANFGKSRGVGVLLSQVIWEDQMSGMEQNKFQLWSLHSWSLNYTASLTMTAASLHVNFIPLNTIRPQPQPNLGFGLSGMCTVTWLVSPDIQSDGEHAVISLHCTVLAITILPTFMLNGYIRTVTVTHCI